jgi:hypothetical protein
MLFRGGSLLVSNALATLVKFVAGDSSVIATFPFICTIVLIELLQDQAVGTLPQRYTPAIQTQLRGLSGQPVVATLLGEICSHVTAATVPNTRSGTVTRECQCVIAFILYLCYVVQLSFDPAMRGRLITRYEREGWSPAEAGGNGLDEGYDTKSFLHSGIHAPNLREVRKRGTYPKDSKPAEETLARDGGCDKVFDYKRRRTGNNASDVFYLIRMVLMRSFGLGRRIVYHLVPASFSV